MIILGIAVCVLAVCCYLLFRKINQIAELIDSESQAITMTQDQIQDLQVQINELEEKISFLANTRHHK